jgi:hypothetical protein
VKHDAIGEWFAVASNTAAPAPDDAQRLYQRHTALAAEVHIGLCGTVSSVVVLPFDAFAAPSGGVSFSAHRVRSFGSVSARLLFIVCSLSLALDCLRGG